jgi:hypothetical protein
VENPAQEEACCARSRSKAKNLSLRGIDSTEIMTRVNSVNENGRWTTWLLQLRMKASEPNASWKA